ncbi:GATA-type zinc finger protein 1 [Myxocyprinus asiaticus]|uniref:GATA-type zinc finger protein 1 n=1 Tax=Myxocyprinus asiaticus TaxID=70543 RepID=UPI002221F268|nr:GATA-type zinc finger protein 1 [Myxocyprinus asiaticus]
MMSSNTCVPHESAEEQQQQQVTQSTILYLLQEATKLTPPADENLSSEHTDAHCGPDDLHKDSSSEFSGSFSVMRECDHSSAWEVMRLINQQCERLLQSSCDDDGDQVDLHLNTVMSSTPSSGALFERNCPVASTHCVPPHVCFSPAVICSSDITNDLTDNEENVKEPDDLAELIMRNTVDDISTTDDTSILHVASTEDSCSDWSQRVESVGLPSGSTADSGIHPLDFTSCLVSDVASVWLPLNVQRETSPSPSADLNNNLRENLNKELQDVQSSSWGPCRRTQRKQPHPVRSPDPQDPDVQGVTFSMYPELDTSTHQCSLIITSNYSEEIRRLKSSRNRSLQITQRSSSSEEESDSSGLIRSKICASCCTRKTPLWRDAEDGTPLCNACGIRYKKYRVRCRQCWNIPKKDANTISKCLKCGDILKMNTQHKYSGW